MNKPVPQFKKGETVYRLIIDKLVDGKWTQKEDGPFKVMGQIENYLMIRRPGCIPLVLSARAAIRDKDIGNE